MKTAQDSLTITIKQNVMFQGRKHTEKIRLDKNQNGRPSSIIYFPIPDIWWNVLDG